MRSSGSISLILMAFILLAFVPKGEAQSKHIYLFNGKDLSGWETQGLGTWSVVNGEIQGRKPPSQPDWAHLVTKVAFQDCYYRLKFKIDSGNSGAYVRGAIGGDFGVTGVQVEMGGNDGSMMTVTKTEWKWMVGNPVANPQAPMGQWHQLAIEVKGQNISTWVNGILIKQAQAVDTSLLPRSGGLALQMHAGAYQNTMRFKEIEVFTPTLIRGCMDSRFKEFNPLANDSDAVACKTVATSLRQAKVIASSRKTEAGKIASRDLSGRYHIQSRKRFK